MFGDMSGPWLSYVHAVERAYLAVWAEELSSMMDAPISAFSCRSQATTSS